MTYQRDFYIPEVNANCSIAFLDDNPYFCKIALPDGEELIFTEHEFLSHYKRCKYVVMQDRRNLQRPRRTNPIFTDAYVSNIKTLAVEFITSDPRRIDLTENGKLSPIHEDCKRIYDLYKTIFKGE